MASVTLTTTSHVVLGLVQQIGPATAYDLKAFADISVGYFWDFPRSQIYAETVKLVEAGLLDEEQEAGGRRRRTLTITPAGRAALVAWASTPHDEVAEIRDRGLLQLFFADAISDDALGELARAQRDAHRRRLADYERIAADVPPDTADSRTLLVLTAGRRLEALYVELWSRLAERPGDPAALSP